MRVILRDIEGALFVVDAQLAGWDSDLDGLYVDNADYAFLIPMSKQEAEKHLFDLMNNGVLNISHLKAVPVVDDKPVYDDQEHPASEDDPFGGVF